MFAGGTAAFPGTLRVGDTVRREARVESVTEKHGRSGTLVVVVVGVELYAPDGTLAVTEQQNLIYREASAVTGEPPSPEPAAALVPGGPAVVPDGPDRWRLVTDPTLLMRFSAATANAHRIHYDWPYATGVEGYPGLVVHGPLMTLALAETHRLGDDDRHITGLAHRNLAPLLCAEPAVLQSVPSESGTAVSVVTHTDPDAEPRIHTTLDLTFGTPGA